MIYTVVLLLPLRLQFQILKSKDYHLSSRSSPPEFNCSAGRRSIRLICLLNWLISDLSHLQLWGRACRVLPFDDISPLECDVVTFWDCVKLVPYWRGSCGYRQTIVLILGENWNSEEKAGHTEPAPSILWLVQSSPQSSLPLIFPLYQLLSYAAKGVCVYVCTLYICTHSFPVSVCKLSKLKIARDGSPYNP